MGTPRVPPKLRHAQYHPHAAALTISCHDTSIWSIHHVPVFFRQCLNVPFAEVEDLFPQHGATLGLSSLLDGEVQKHHPPYETKSHQEKAQLLRGQLPGSKESHLSLATYPSLGSQHAEGEGKFMVQAGGRQCAALTPAPGSADLLAWLPFCCGGGGRGQLARNTTIRSCNCTEVAFRKMPAHFLA